MKNRRAVVVIPVHSPNPSQEELLSFERCFLVLSSFHIVVLHPEGLDLSLYRSSVSAFRTKSISPHWQSSLEGYNLLKTSREFYEILKQYKYILTYELDAYVFKNELEYWCNKKYDYIGAPWVEGWNKPKVPFNFIGVGNSGFSLRNVKSCLKALNRIEKLKKLYKFYLMLNVAKYITFIEFLKYSKFDKLFKMRSFKYLEDLLLGTYINEDGFWAIWIANTFQDFIVAPVDDALSFSFEVEPRELYVLNKGQLPFGCHAWMKYGSDFWKSFIKF